VRPGATSRLRMVSTNVQAGASPASKSLASRFVGVIVAPRATYESIVAHPKWFGMLALTLLIVIIGTTLPMTTEAGREALLDTQVRQMQAFGVDVSDQMYEQMRSRIGFAPYTNAAGILFAVPILAAIFAGILYLVFNVMMGGTATFKQVFTVVVHAGVISSLGQLFTGPLNYLRGSVTSATNLSVLLPMLTEGSFAARLAGMIDFFMLWWVFVLAVGIAVLYRRRTQPIALSLYGVYAAIAVVFAAIMSRLGGTS
jgi:hypothetical protein